MIESNAGSNYTVTFFARHDAMELMQMITSITLAWAIEVPSSPSSHTTILVESLG